MKTDSSNKQLKENKFKELMKPQEEEEEYREIQKEIRHLEAELDWADSQASDDYKYITHLENRLDKLYERVNALEER